MCKPVILVTGGSSGIGRATAESLAPHAGTLYVASRRQPAGLAANARWLAMDVRDRAQVRSGVQRVLDESGRIDVLVNNAGVMLAGIIEETELQAARSLFDTNFWGAAAVNAEVLPAMRHQRDGQLIMVGSLAGRVGTPGQGFYCAAKFALAGYTEALAAEVAGFGIRVNLVEPGFHRTELHQHMLEGGVACADYEPVRERVERAIRSNIAGGGDPRDVARVIERLVVRRATAFRHPVGSDARWVPRIRQLVPEGMFRAVLRRKFGLAARDLSSSRT